MNMIKDGCKMKLTFDERMLMTLYNGGTRGGTINNLKNMRICISYDETFLRNLTDSVLSKLAVRPELHCLTIRGIIRKLSTYLMFQTPEQEKIPVMLSSGLWKSDTRTLFQRSWRAMEG